jgi:putative salt-induced outer membrane protein
MRLRLLGLFAFAAVPLASALDAPPAPPPPPWSGEASVGLVVTTGNSESETLNAKGEVIYQSKIWRNTLNGTAIKTQQTNKETGLEEKTAERYLAGNKTDFNFDERNYAFLALEYEKDLFGPTRERTSETAGYGRKILTGPKHTLEAEIGAGARQTLAQETVDEPDPERETDGIGRARVAYKWNFSDTSYFTETAKAESGSTNTFVESITELRVTLIGKLFAVTSYTVRTNSDVPEGTRKTDTITAFNLGWTFNK